jgi:autotransporter-associated beta strand protein
MNNGATFEGQSNGGYIGDYANALTLSGSLNFIEVTGKNSAFTGNILLGGPGEVLNFSGGAGSVTSHAYQFLGVISDGGHGYGLTVEGGTLYLGGADTYTGLTTINSSGTLVIGSNNGTGGSSGGGATGSLAATGAIVDNGTLEFERTTATIIQGTDFSSSGITGSGILIENASGNNLTLNAVNTYTGGTTITTGTLTIAGAGQLGAGSYAANISNAGAFIYNSTAAQIFSGSISGTGTLTDSGAGTLTLKGGNSYTGATSITAGMLVAENATALGAGSVANVTVASGAGLQYEAQSSTALTIGGTLTITGGAGTVLGTSIGSTTTGAEINVTGAATISNAALTVNVYGVSGVSPATGTYTLITGGAGSNLNPSTAPTLGLVYNNSNFTVGTLTPGASSITLGITAQTQQAAEYWTGGLTGATNVWAASNGTTASNWVTTAGGGATAQTPGSSTAVTIAATTPTLAPTSTVLGDNMTINSLTIATQFGLNADGNTLTITPSSSANGITMNSAVAASAIAANVALGASQTWTNNSANALTVSGNVSGAYELSIAGTGQLILTGTVGMTPSSGNSLQITGGSTLQTTGVVTENSGNIVFGSGTLNINGGSFTTNKTVALGNLATGSTLTISAGTFTINSGGGLYLGQTSAFGGATVNLNGGTLATAVGFTTPTNKSGNVFNFNGGTLQLIASPTTVITAGAAYLTVNVQSGGAIIDINGDTTAISSVLTGASSGGLTLKSTAGGGTLTLSGANTYTGATTVNGGTLTAGVASVAGVSGAFGINSAVTLANTSGAALNITGFNTQIGSLAGGGSTGGNVTLGAATLTIAGSSIAASYAGVIAGSGGALTMNASGTQTLTGVSTYTGATTVSAGTLIVSGSLSGTASASVTSGATLEVDGSLNKSAAIAVAGTLDGTGSVGAFTATGGTVAAGLSTADSQSSTGTLTTSGAVNLSASTNFKIRLGMLSGGTDSDQLAATGGNSSVSLNGANLQLTLGSNINPSLIGAFYLIINGGAGSTGGSNEFAQGTSITSGGYTFAIDYAVNYVNSSTINEIGSGDDVVLELTAIPEPSTWACMLAGAGMLILIQKNRRRKNLKSDLKLPGEARVSGRGVLGETAAAPL